MWSLAPSSSRWLVDSDQQRQRHNQDSQRSEVASIRLKYWANRFVKGDVVVGMDTTKYVIGLDLASGPDYLAMRILAAGRIARTLILPSSSPVRQELRLDLPVVKPPLWPIWGKAVR